ncbi:MAG: 4Fe-4S dicluster domain-containing protein [Eggerthellaceae bacterium]
MPLRASTSWWWDAASSWQAASMMPLRRNASVTICHSKTENLADIMFGRRSSAPPVALDVRRTVLRPGSDGTDVASTSTRRETCGDVDFAEVELVVAAYHAGAGRYRHGHHVGDDGATVAAAEAAWPRAPGGARRCEPLPDGPQSSLPILLPASAVRRAWLRVFIATMCRTTRAVPRLTLVTTRTISACRLPPLRQAPCVDACPTGCLFTDDEHVGVHPDKCIGCRNCVLACPYGGGNRNQKLPEPEAASGTEAAAASAQDDRRPRAGSREEASARNRPWWRDCAPIAPAAGVRGGVHRRCGSSMRSSWRARQNKRKAAARASASFASMKLNAALTRGVGSWKSMAVCLHCGAGCKMNLVVENGQVIDAAPPGITNEGELCLKGMYGYDFVNDTKILTPRIYHPMIRRTKGAPERSLGRGARFHGPSGSAP